MGGKSCKLIEDVAGDQHRDAVLAVELQDQLPHLDDALGVKAVDRLIQHQKVRAARQRHGNAQPLPHAEGEIFRFLLPGAVQPHQMQQLRDAVR